MPLTAKLIDGKWRVVEEDGTLCRNAADTPCDGGGHSTEKAAKDQARAINASQAKRGT